MSSVTFISETSYVSPLLFRNILFHNSPVMPAMIAIHERKLKVTHDEMMRIVAKQLPYLVNGNCKVPIATDDETGFTAAIDDHLTNVRRLLCWNHSINAAKVWLRKHSATASEVPVYLSHLLHQKTEEEYCEVLEELRENWSEAFLTYYMEVLDEKVYIILYSFIVVNNFCIIFTIIVTGSGKKAHNCKKRLSDT